MSIHSAINAGRKADVSLYSPLISPVITLMVGKEGRLFAAHEDVLCLSPFFAAVCRGKFLDAQSKRIELPDEEPEIFSCILEYLYVRYTIVGPYAMSDSNNPYRRATTTHARCKTSVEALGSSRMQ